MPEVDRWCAFDVKIHENRRRIKQEKDPVRLRGGRAPSGRTTAPAWRSARQFKRLGMASQAALDALIRQQNEAVLGGEDVGRVLAAYEARKHSGQRQPTRPRQPPPAPAARAQPAESIQALSAGMHAAHIAPPRASGPPMAQPPAAVASHAPNVYTHHPGQQLAPPPSSMMRQHAPQHPPQHAMRAHAPPPPESVDAVSRAGGGPAGPASAASRMAAQARTRKEPSGGGSAYVSTQMESLLQPVRNEREALKRAGLQPHNYHHDNVQKIREKQHAVQTRKQAEDMESHRQEEARRRARQQAMSTASKVEQRPGAAAAKPAPPATVQRHGSYGKVPKYLAERKAVREEEEQLARAEAERQASCPPGARARADASPRPPLPPGVPGWRVRGRARASLTCGARAP